MFAIIAKKRRVEPKLFWAKEMTPNGNLRPQEQMKRTRSGK